MAALVSAVFSLYFEGFMLAANYPGMMSRTTRECASQCFADKSCLTFFYNKQSGQCKVLHSRDKPEQNEMIEDTDSRCYTLLKDVCPIQKKYRLSRNPPLCYRISNEEVNHDDAMAVCNKDGGFLVRIDSQEKQDYFARLNSETPENTRAWIDGKNNMDVDNEWRFSDGTLITYLPWCTPCNQPDQAGKCVRFYVRSNYKWFDTECHGQFIYVCEIAITEAKLKS